MPIELMCECVIHLIPFNLSNSPSSASDAPSSSHHNVYEQHLCYISLTLHEE